MIALRAGDRALIIVDEGNFKRWREHKPFTADFAELFGLSARIGAVQIVWTPDLNWVAAELAKTDGSIEAGVRVLEAAKSRPIVDSGEQPYHPMFRIKFDHGGNA